MPIANFHYPLMNIKVDQLPNSKFPYSNNLTRKNSIITIDDYNEQEDLIVANLYTFE